MAYKRLKKLRTWKQRSYGKILERQRKRLGIPFAVIEERAWVRQRNVIMLQNCTKYPYRFSAETRGDIAYALGMDPLDFEIILARWAVEYYTKLNSIPFKRRKQGFQRTAVEDDHTVEKKLAYFKEHLQELLTIYSELGYDD